MTTSHWFQWKVNCVQPCCQKCQLRSHWSMVLAAALGHFSPTHSFYDLCRDSLQINSFHLFFFFNFQGVSVDIHNHSQPLLCSPSFILHLNNFTAWIWPVLQLKGKAKQCLHFGERLEPLAVNFSFGVSPQGPFTLYFASDKTRLLFIKNNGALIILIKKTMAQGWWWLNITPTCSPGPGQSEVELGTGVSLILPWISASATPGVHGKALSSRGQELSLQFPAG